MSSNLLKQVKKRSNVASTVTSGSLLTTSSRGRGSVNRGRGRGVGKRVKFATPTIIGKLTQEEGSSVATSVSYKDPWYDLSRVPESYLNLVIDDFSRDVNPADLFTIKILNYLRYVLPWFRASSFLKEYVDSRISSEINIRSFYDEYSRRSDVLRDIDRSRKTIRKRSALKYKLADSNLPRESTTTIFGKDNVTSFSSEMMERCVAMYVSDRTSWLPDKTIVGMAIKKRGPYASVYGDFNQVVSGKKKDTKKGWIKVLDRSWYPFVCSGNRKFLPNQVAYVVLRSDGEKVDLVVENLKMYNESELERRFGYVRSQTIDQYSKSAIIKAMKDYNVVDSMILAEMFTEKYKDSSNQDLFQIIAIVVESWTSAISADDYHLVLRDHDAFLGFDWDNSVRDLSVKRRVRGKFSDKDSITVDDIVDELKIDRELAEKIIDNFSEEFVVELVSNVSSVLTSDDLRGQAVNFPRDFVDKNWSDVYVDSNATYDIVKRLFVELLKFKFDIDPNVSSPQMFTMGNCDSTLRSAPWIKLDDSRKVISMAVKRNGPYEKFASDERVKRDWYKVISSKWYAFACSGKRKFLKRQVAYVVDNPVDVIVENQKMFDDSERRLFSKGGIPPNELVVMPEYVESAKRLFDTTISFRDSGLSSEKIVREIQSRLNVESNGQLIDAVIRILIYLIPVANITQTHIDRVRKGQISETNLVKLLEENDRNYRELVLPEIYANPSVDGSVKRIVENRLETKSRQIENEFYAISAPEKRVSSFTPTVAGKRYLTVALPKCATDTDDIIYYREGDTMHCFDRTLIKNKLANPETGKEFSYDFIRFVSLIDDPGTHGSVEKILTTTMSDLSVTDREELAPGLIELLRDEILSLNGIRCEQCSLEMFIPAYTTVSDREKVSFCSHACFESFESPSSRRAQKRKIIS